MLNRGSTTVEGRALLCLFIQIIWGELGQILYYNISIIDTRVHGAYGAVSESLCIGRLINRPPKLTFSSPFGAKVVTYGPYTKYKYLFIYF